MKLLTEEIKKAFRKQGCTSEKLDKEIKIICKFFSPIGCATWYCFEYDEENELFRGVADLGFDCKEVGDISLHEMEAVRLPLGLRIERDLYFRSGEFSVADVLKEENYYKGGNYDNNKRRIYGIFPR